MNSTLELPPPARLMTWRAMARADTVTGTVITVSPKRGTLPVASLTPLAKSMPRSSSVSDVPLNCTGASFGFCRRSCTAMRTSRPWPGSDSMPASVTRSGSWPGRPAQPASSTRQDRHRSSSLRMMWSSEAREARSVAPGVFR